MSDTFLTRWSRRKLEGGAAAAEPQIEAEQQSVPPSAPREEEIADDAITAEEIAALPAIADITANTDITAFLRRGVPAFLRNAALQRLWVLDPEIRNFVGDARDYAWDWNTPGGVPVSGALEPGTDIQAMLSRVFGEESPQDAARENVIVESGRESIPAARELPAPANTPTPDHATQIANSSIVSAEEALHEDAAPVRRHGGALPA